MVNVGDKIMLPHKFDENVHHNETLYPCIVEWIHPKRRFVRVSFELGWNKKKVYQSYLIRNGSVVI